MRVNIYTMAMCCFAHQAGAFVVSVDECSPPYGYSQPGAEKIYEFKFDSYAVSPDIEIQVSKNVFSPDFTVALTSDIAMATLAVVDDLESADIRICNSKYGISHSDTNVLKVSEYSVSPDVKIKIVGLRDSPDYILFAHSDRLSDEEAVAFFAALWEAKSRNAVKAYQLQFRQGGQWVGGPLYADRWSCSDARWAGPIGARCEEVLIPED